MFCPFVLFLWPLFCLIFFDLWILIAPLVSSNSSSYTGLLSCLPILWKRLIENSTKLLSVTWSNIKEFEEEKNRNCIKVETHISY